MPATSNVTPKWRSRGVCITSFRTNDWTDLPPGVTYLAWGDETCPTTGRPHKQAFAYSTTDQRFSWWHARFPRDHIEKMRGNFRENEAYITKEGELKELGDKPMLNGQQKAKHHIVELMTEGMHPLDIATEHGDLTETVGRYNGFWKDLYNHVTMKKLREGGYQPRQVFIHIGPNGTGKSKQVFDDHPASDVYIMPRADGKWYGNYTGQPVVVFNDVRSGNIMSISDWLNITDGYPIEVEIKGAFVPWKPKVIYFTSNQHWREWWPFGTVEDYAAVRRRVAEIRLYKSDSELTFE